MILPILTASMLLNYDNFLFDLDGVLKKGGHFIPSSVRFINYLQQQGKNVVFLTNNDWVAPEERAESFRQKGMKYVDKNSFIIPAMVAIDYLKENGYYNSTIYALTPEYVQFRLKKDLNATLIEENPRIINKWNFTELTETIKKSTPDIVMLDSYVKWTMENIAKCINWLQNMHVKFMVLAPDTQFRGSNNLILPVSGAIQLGIEKVTGRKATVMGKPSPALNAFIAKTRKFDQKRTIMFGDLLQTDIAMARENGFDSALVLTGVSTLKNVDKAVKDNCNCIPTFLANITSIMFDLDY